MSRFAHCEYCESRHEVGCRVVTDTSISLEEQEKIAKSIVKENVLLRRRYKAQAQLLVCYRLGKRPSERLLKELADSEVPFESGEG